MAWHPSHEAPRDRWVWLFLPSAEFKAAANGTVSDVKHVAVVGQWNAARGAWITREDGREVYPSLWSDANPNGVMPDNPLLEA
jgi:hypothetical protein